MPDPPRPPAAESRPARRRAGRALAELHYRLRTEGDTPGRHAAAIGLGVFIGCLPLYGAHLALCFLLGRLLGLNRLNMYLAAHLNNPLTAPWLVLGELAVGHRLVLGHWPTLGPGGLRSLPVAELGGMLLAGALLLGAGLGAAGAAVAFTVGRGARGDPPWMRLAEATARRYFDCGAFHWEFARGKLRRDPLYREVLRRLEHGLTGRAVDLGCGRGLLLALLDTARGDAAAAAAGGAEPLQLVGVECRPRLVAVARQALGDSARIEIGDLEAWEPQPAEHTFLLDVLHYLSAGGQERLLARLAAALPSGGRLLIREADASHRLRFLLTRLQERLCALARGHWRQRFRYRGAGEWTALLERAGLAVTVTPLWRGTPFANVLIEATKP